MIHVRKTKFITKKPKLLMFDLGRIFLNKYKKPIKSSRELHFPFEIDLTDYLGRYIEPECYKDLKKDVEKKKIFENVRIGDVLGKTN